MFCPDGYVPLAEVFHETSDLWSHYIGELTADIDDTGFDYETVKSFLMHRSLADIAEDNIFFSFGHNVFICSPDGSILRLSVVRLMIEYHTWAAGLDFLKTLETEELLVASEVAELKQAHGLSDKPMNELINDFERTASDRQLSSLIDFLDGYNDQPEHNVVAPFYERQGYTISLRFLRLLEASGKYDNAKFKTITDLLRPFEGWAMCVKRSFIEDSWYPEFEASLAEPDEARLNRKSGRPNHKFLSAMKAYNTLYPNGHRTAGDTWKQVAKKVADETGLDISIDVIRRAENELNALRAHEGRA